MTREPHARFCERPRGQFPRPTLHFGMKAHIGVDADAGFVHTVTTTSANPPDLEQVEELLHGKEEVVLADASYAGAQNHVRRKGLRLEIAAKRSHIKAMKDGREKRALIRPSVAVWER